MTIEQVFEHHHDQLMAVPGVVGVGIGAASGEPAIVVMVRKLTSAITARIPRALEGHPVVVEESAEIIAF